MRSRIIVKSHPLHTWFPEDDEMASHVARLCVLREDFWMEFHGFASEEEIKLLDSNSQTYRRLYFLRNLVKTVNEIHETIRALNSMAVFRTALDNLPYNLKNDFQAGLKFLNQNQKIITRIRNNLGGHVSHKALDKALHWREGNAEAICAISDDPRHTRFYFAQNLCSIVMFHDTPPEKVLRVLFQEIHAHAYKVIHSAFAAYISTKTLMPL